MSPDFIQEYQRKKTEEISTCYTFQTLFFFLKKKAFMDLFVFLCVSLPPQIPAKYTKGCCLNSEEVQQASVHMVGMHRGMLSGPLEVHNPPQTTQSYQQEIITSCREKKAGISDINHMLIVKAAQCLQVSLQQKGLIYSPRDTILVVPGQ